MCPPLALVDIFVFVCVVHTVYLYLNWYFCSHVCTGCFQYQKGEKEKSCSAKVEKSYIYCKLLEKIFLVGCNLFFIIVLNIARNI